MTDRKQKIVSAGLKVWTIGHSTRTIDEFINLLKENGIKNLIDVRRFPGSRKYPHFNQPLLAASLAKEQIGYTHLAELGGRRKVNPNSQNTLWRNESFRGYADYMETDEFSVGIERLVEAAIAKRTAFMCSEAVWWRCHRSMISDYLKAAGAEVIHLMGESKTQEHPYTSAARIVDGELSYRKYL